jgi:hypothetical protein
MDPIGRRIPSPGTIKSGSTKLAGWSRVSRTNARMASEERSLRGLWMGKGIEIEF